MMPCNELTFARNVMLANNCVSVRTQDEIETVLSVIVSVWNWVGVKLCRNVQTVVFSGIE